MLKYICSSLHPTKVTELKQLFFRKGRNTKRKIIKVQLSATIATNDCNLHFVASTKKMKEGMAGNRLT